MDYVCNTNCGDIDSEPLLSKSMNDRMLEGKCMAKRQSSENLGLDKDKTPLNIKSYLE